MTTPRLAPRLVPAPLWGWSAAQLLKGARWKRIRSDAIALSGGSCAVCGDAREKGMICDEEWTYAEGIATLTSLRIVCPDCDAVTHIGSTARRGYGDMARDHMCRVSSLSMAEADSIIDASFAEWRTRSAETWTVQVAPDLLARYPELATLAGHRAGPGDGRAYS